MQQRVTACPLPAHAGVRRSCRSSSSGGARLTGLAWEQLCQPALGAGTLNPKPPPPPPHRVADGVPVRQRMCQDRSVHAARSRQQCTGQAVEAWAHACHWSRVHALK